MKKGENMNTKEFKNIIEDIIDAKITKQGEIKRIVQEENGKYEATYNGLLNQLQTTILVDIMASLMKEEEVEVKNEKGTLEVIKQKNFDDFDEMVANSKELLKSVSGIPQFDLKSSIQDSLDNIDRIQTECKYSMKILQWLDKDVLEEGK